MIENLRDMLGQLGYSVMEFPKEFRTRPLYRESGNNTSLRINKATGNWRDYGMGIGGTFPDLVKLTLGLKTLEEAETYLSSNFQYKSTIKRAKPTLQTVKTFPPELLTSLFPEHDYWLNRNISIETLKLFEGGVVKAGKMANRYTFPVFDSKRNILGFSGRDLTNKSPIKWKHIGSKSEWRYPLFINYSDVVDAREVILVESIGDALSLYEAGVKNFMVTFGIELSLAITNTLLKIDPNRIIIALNNEPDNNSIGNNASKKMKNKLARHFDEAQLRIVLPTKKDFNDMLKDGVLTIKNWYAQIN